MVLSRIRAIGRPILKFIILLALMLVLGFIVPRIMPGNPLTSSEGRNLPSDIFQSFSGYYAPDQSIWQQFVLYIGHLAKLDLGYSFFYKLPVFNLILLRLPYTLFLSLVALILATLVAVPSGLWSAINSRKESDRIAVLGNVVIQSVPVFLIAVFLQLFIAYRWHFLPSQGAYTPGIMPFTTEFWPDALRHSILPIVAVFICLVPSIFLLTRSITMKVKKEKYVELAGYLNIKKGTIRSLYILRNSLPEIISKLNIHFVMALAGTVFVEIIFSYPGLGTLTKTAVDARDYPLIQGIFLFLGVYGILVNLLFEWFQRRINPWQSE
jgi:peptide/nickel transport system permease protein